MKQMVGLIVDGLSRCSPRCGNTLVVAIDGRAGSGKSTLAERAALALNCPVLSMEGLYAGWTGLAQGVSALVDNVLTPLSEHRVAEVPHFDWNLMTWVHSVPLTPPPLLIVEGVGAATINTTPFTSLVVWLELNEQIRRERALSRQLDGVAFTPHWDEWARQEDALFANDSVWRRADLVFDTSGAVL